MTNLSGNYNKKTCISQKMGYNKNTITMICHDQNTKYKLEKSNGFELGIISTELSEKVRQTEKQGKQRIRD
jgi:hypothetical protein